MPINSNLQSLAVREFKHQAMVLALLFPSGTSNLDIRPEKRTEPPVSPSQTETYGIARAERFSYYHRVVKESRGWSMDLRKMLFDAPAQLPTEKLDLMVQICEEEVFHRRKKTQETPK